ncbi:MAG TPA: hypothetical protein VNO52_18530 [Methylomirabilota bacterium]|nr:hypothetical protein [Methylomirabilota bacterium]
MDIRPVSCLPPARVKGVVTLVLWFVGAVMTSPAADGPRAGRVVAPGVRQVGTIESRFITESSGIVASRQFPGTFWTHNDKGSRPMLFAITREGKSLAEIPIQGAKFADWEDIALDGEHRLYLGDIGNNNSRRKDVEVYRVAEPDPKSPPGALEPSRKWVLTYPVAPFDAEALFVYGESGYVVSKVTNDRHASIYRFPLTEAGGTVALQRVTTLPISSPVTAADLSADGQRLAILSKAGPFVFRVDGDIARAGVARPWHTRFKHEATEACCFVPEGLLVTAESREIFLFEDAAFRAP